MKKLQLQPDDLHVETFAPVGDADPDAGTVEGRQLPETFSCNGTCYWPTECDSCAASCDATTCCQLTRTRHNPDSCPCYPEG